MMFEGTDISNIISFSFLIFGAAFCVISSFVVLSCGIITGLNVLFSLSKHSD